MLKLLRLPLILALLCLTGCASTQDSLFNLGLKAERSMSDLTLKRIRVADHDWVYLDSEVKQKPTILLLHGFAVDKDNWLRFARYFDDYRVIAPDLPGHGETSFNPEYTYDFAQQAAWLAEFVEALELNELHLVGNSMGGGIALLYSHSQPERVRSITLVDAAGVLPPNKSEFQTIIDNGGKNPLIVNSKDDFIHLSEFAMEQQPFLPWPATNVLSRRAQLRNDINHQIFADIQAVAEEAKRSDDNLKMLQQIKEPVLIIWGEEDRVLDVSSVQVFEQYLPDSRSVIFPEVGHAPMLEIPQESAEVVLEFVKEVEARSSSALADTE